MSNVFTRLRAFRRVFAVAAVGGLFAGLVAANPSWAKAAGLDVWNVRNLERSIEAAALDHDRMVVEDVMVMQRIATKEKLVKQLIEGQVSLADATTQFLALSADQPGYITILRLNYPGDTDTERAAHNVIDYVTQRVASPAARETLACRLAAELVQQTHPSTVGN